MKKAFVLMILIIVVLFGVVFGYKALVHEKQKEFVQKHSKPIITITAMKAAYATWQKQLSVVSTLRTVKGVNVTTELGGMVDEIDFMAGQDVQAGQLLAKLDIRPDVAKLHALQAEHQLAQITLTRDRKQFAFGGVSRETLDTDISNEKSLRAQVEEQKAIISKKIIHAPFTGRLGIRLINLGQYLNPGSAVATLQSLDPIYCDFFVPQRQVLDLALGETIKLSLQGADRSAFYCQITTINPVVDEDIRNIEVEATCANPKKTLLPGMFGHVTFSVGKPQKYLTLPVLAVTFNPYGSIVFILKKTKKTFQGKTVWQANQQFVTAGDTRGNQIAVVKGIKEGDMIVTSGQLKLQNGSLVVINNAVAPSNNPNPKVTGED